MVIKRAFLLSALLPFIAMLIVMSWSYAEDRTITKKEKMGATHGVNGGAAPRVNGGAGVNKESAAPVTGARYYALIIGNDDYKNLEKLKTAVNDARDIEKMLREKYGFQTKLLINATRSDILKALNDYRKKLTRDDNFLIYYAGHGEHVKENDAAYWLPVDAQRDDNSDWIIAEEITKNVKLFSSAHVLIVADSCYSGSMTRAAETSMASGAERQEYLRKMLERPSRTLMASGGDEPVSDAGGTGNHSVFAGALLKALDEANRDMFTADEIFHERVRTIVAGKSDQVPQYGDLKNSGHEGGDFVFRLAKAQPVEKASRPAEAKKAPEGVRPPASMGVRPPASENEEARRVATARRPAKEELSGGKSRTDAGIITDPGTGLQWYVGPDKDTTWDQASSWVKGLPVGGGWRMPTRAELRGLYHKGMGSRNMPPEFKTTGWRVWSGEQDSSSNAWAFGFGGRGEISGLRGFSYDDRAFAVRSRR
jgi:uncharacterized caspase-like protein